MCNTLEGALDELHRSRVLEAALDGGVDVAHG
jgi:hypothetical protein